MGSRRPARSACLVAVLLACSLVAGCGIGLGTAGGYVPSGRLGPKLQGLEPLDGASVSVGSKNFTEEILLGKLTVILLRAAGAKVQDLTNIPGSAASRQAQLAGQVDLEWEYTGTAWLTYLGHDKAIPDPQKQYEVVRKEDLRKNDLVWLPPAPMNDTYGFAITDATYRKYHITRGSQLRHVPVPARTFCVESEFTDRPDGLKGYLKEYGVPLGDPQGVPRGNIKTLQTGAIYSATAKGGLCNFGEIFTTDGRIKALHLRVLKDDRNFFPKYNGCLVVRREVLDQYPQIRRLFARVTQKLTNATLVKLNGEVDVDGRDPAQVAFDWLRREGFIAGK
ncbi:MAG TPA: glycine betaine ABC transporter substrate-binding protein [Marmoricola sp.]|nr:glycine betaine ABC transporter substrate-binding protein [Marmoricola sp.]